MPASRPESCLAPEIDPVRPPFAPLPANRVVLAAFSAISAIGFVFLIGIPLPANGAGVGCDGEWANSPICRERQAAVDARARAEALLERLPDLAEPPWDPAEFESGETLYREGMALYRDEYFGDAASRFQSATDRLIGIEQEFQAFVAERLAAADAALREEEFEAAAAGYDAVLVVLPESGAASLGLSTANRGMAAREALEQASHAIGQGDFATAESRLESIPPGLLSDGVAQARRQIRASRQQDRLSRSMSRGFRHLDRAEWQEAEAAFTEALRADPASAAARDALEDLRRRRAGAELAAHRDRLQGQVELENWAEALALLERMRELDPDDAATAVELSRVGHLADVERRIDGYLSRPQRLSAKGVRDRVTALLHTTADADVYGARIMGKRERLLQSLATWTTPVELTIRSDDRTEVRIRPGRVLGRFRERRLEVFPGDYVLSGRRVGYREVSLQVAVAPGADAVSFEVVCHERF